MPKFLVALLFLHVVMEGIVTTYHCAQSFAGILIASLGGGVNMLITHGVFAPGCCCCWWWQRRRLTL